MLRITRLYPLHLVTLVMVAGLQLLFYRQTGDYFVYGANDLRRFVMSLMFFQANGPGGAFNGPTWSITVELAMYVLFCIAAWTGILRYRVAPVLIFLGGLSLYSGHRNIAMGICGFFEGGLVYYLFSRARLSVAQRKIFVVTVAACMLGWLLVIISNYTDIITEYDIVIPIVPINGKLLELCASYILFPLTILAFAMQENITTFSYEYLSWLGSISYSSYLLHFPLQIVFALTIVSGVIPLWAKDTSAFLLIYFAILVAISLLSFRRFETPVQRMLRQSWRNMVQALSVRRRQQVEPAH
jgi:peptidoglycan/LPS O-acetylase OafA/YrhL